MGRAGFSDDCWDDNDERLATYRWRAIIRSATLGKRGQRFFRALVTALDAMPEKRLIAGDLENDEGAVCALGCLGKARGVDMSQLDVEQMEDDGDWDKLGEAFDIAPQLSREVMWHNDEAGSHNRSPEERWQYVRNWAARKIVPTEAELDAPTEQS